MKRVVLGLIIILVAVYVVLSIVTSADEYRAERLFHNALQASKKVIINPDVAPPALIVSVENKFKRVIEKYPQTETAKRAHMALAEFWMANKKYDKAVSALNAIIEAEDKNVPLLSKAHFFKATAFEKLDQWDSAVDEYMILRDRYFKTSVGLLVPLYLGRCYAKKGESQTADKAYKDAILFYEQLEINKRGSPLGFAAQDLLRQAYMDLEKYEAAGKVLGDTINNYPSKRILVNYLPLVESIYVEKLARPAKAVEIYKNLMEKTEDGKLKEFLQGRIEALQGESQE